MTYVITGHCINDGACVLVCPVDCIQPATQPDKSDMLFINPGLCVDCNACAEICPVNAIYHEYRLPSDMAEFKAINARYFELLEEENRART